MTDEIITIADVRNAGYCVKGARRWFENHDLDFREFLANGIPAKEFIEKGDHLAARIVRLKRERRKKRGR